MTKVRNVMCGNKGCSKRSSFGVEGGRKTEYCAKHASAGMVSMYSKKCGNEGYAKQSSFGLEGSRKIEYCAQHARSGGHG